MLLSRPRMPVACTLMLLFALVFSLTACKSKKSRLPETTNSTGITMVDIPAGSFVMGDSSTANLIGQPSSAYPSHTVNVPAFQISKTEITVKQYKKFLAAIGREGAKQLQDTDFLKHNGFGDDAPVVNVSMKDVNQFIAWLNDTEGGGYRLPSEAEWEYACRAGGNDTYCGGNKRDSLGWDGSNSGNRMQAVAQKKSNAFGLYDMSGNAGEWIADCWHSDYDGAPTDGSAWIDEPKCQYNVVRDGRWVTSRDRQSPNFNYPWIGIRLARTH